MLPLGTRDAMLRPPEPEAWLAHSKNLLLPIHLLSLLEGFRSCTLISRAYNEHPVWRSHGQEATRGETGEQHIPWHGGGLFGIHVYAVHGIYAFMPRP